VQHNIIEARKATKICGNRSGLSECIGLAAMGSRKWLLLQIHSVANATRLWHVYMYCDVTLWYCS